MSNEEQPIAETTDVAASGYIVKEVEDARKALKNTKIFGTIICVLLSAELIFVATKFIWSLQPTQAAEIASGIISQQIADRGEDISASIKEKVPAMIEQAPDYAKQQLPKYRVDLEDKVDKDLRSYVKSTSSDLDKRLDEYFTGHKTEIKTVLEAGADPKAVHQVGGEIREQIMAYLNDKPAQGESIGNQIDQSLKDIKEVQSQVNHLAANQNLTPAEKQTRRALAIIAQTVSKEKLQPLPIQEAIKPVTP
ncbi:MAG: hypothetical protein P4L33_20610 [Capsulimonadaceae bacterium]|nr:hypothetical protein [Capsulimonadaceae bacterium]